MVRHKADERAILRTDRVHVPVVTIQFELIPSVATHADSRTAASDQYKRDPEGVVNTSGS